MRIQISLILLFFSFAVFAHESEQEVKDLFDRYDQVMSGEKMKSTEVFTQNFLEDFDADKLNEKRLKLNYKLEIKEGLRDKNLLFVKRIFNGKDPEATTFIIVKEKNSWRIQGTTSDDH